MKIYRCRICGETYLGSEAPSHCPFCGAHREFLVDPKTYSANVNDVTLTETERADLQAAVELERVSLSLWAAIPR